MKKAGINSVSLGIFAWATLEPEEGVYNFDWMEEIMDNLYENGIYTILATPSAARPAWLDEKYPEVMRADAMGVRRRHGGRANSCMSNPVFREKIGNLNRKLAERFSHHPGLVMWHVNNEPCGVCFCDSCAATFRKYLSAKFDNDIEKLNDAWWTAFWSRKYNNFDQIEPPYSNGEFVTGLHLEYKRFMTWAAADLMKHEMSILREANPAIPITTNVMEMQNSLDLHEYVKEMDAVSWDSYPSFHNNTESLEETLRQSGFNHNMMRSLKKDRPFMMMESAPGCASGFPYNKQKRPGVHKMHALQAIACGSDTVQYFQIRKSRGGFEQHHGAVIDHAGINNRIFREVAEVGEMLKKLAPVAGTTVPAKVALLFDWDNRWSLQLAQGMRNGDRGYEKTCVEIWKAFNKVGVEIDIVSSTDDLSDYKVLVAPMMYMTHPGVAEVLKKFVAEGGQLLSTYLTGYIDENQLCHLGGFPGDDLTSLFGIISEEIDTLYPTDKNHIEFADGTRAEAFDFCELLQVLDADVLAKYTDDYVAGTAAVTKKAYGKGNAYYVAARVAAKDMVPLFEQMLADAGIPTMKAPEGIVHHTRIGEEGEYDFYFNATTEPIALPDLKGYDMLREVEVDGTVEIEGYGVVVIKRA